MFWKLFSSEERVQQALDQSVGYDISPNILRAPEPVQQEMLDLWKDFAFFMPANSQDSRSTEGVLRARKKA
jgi:hypothetical protein